MLDANQCHLVKSELPPFRLTEPFHPAANITPCMQNYLEFYGFFEVLKAVDVQYFWGYRTTLESGRIATHYWKNPEHRGCIFLVHGLFDHVGLFLHLVRHFLEHGYSVIAVDLPGHGLSDGEVASIGSFSEYRDVLLDTELFFRSETAGKPLYGVGQSTGAAALMSMVFFLQKQDQLNKTKPAPVFERLVFLGPLVQPARWTVSRWIYRLVGSYLKSVTRDFSSPNTHNAEFHNFLKNYDPLQSKRLPTRWVGALYEWVNDFAQQPMVDTPLLIVQGTGDKVVEWRVNVPLIKEHFSCVQVNMIEGARHHLANEANPWRKAIYTGVVVFLRQRVVCASQNPAQDSAPDSASV